MEWRIKSFSDLSTEELYELLKLRIDVFVVEQTCFYPDIDGHDKHPDAIHVMAFENDTCIAYLRILPPQTTYGEMPSIGRVATAESSRGGGLGHDLLTKGLIELDKRWPTLICHISAQEHLQKYYQKHGFVSVGEGYLEDDIPHIGMERQPANAA